MDHWTPSRIATTLGCRRITYDRLTGMAALLAPTSPDVSTEAVLLLEAAEEGWWYSVPLPDGALLVVYMTDLDSIARSGLPRSVFWEIHLGRTQHTPGANRRFPARRTDSHSRRR